MELFHTIIELLTLGGVAWLLYTLKVQYAHNSSLRPPSEGPISQLVAHGVHVTCDTCHNVVARYNRDEAGKVKCANCISGNK